ncbi:hypothetical protein HK100_006486 [Physocladia obscura]|uniref:Alpha-1,3-mannosyltransferase n=1 Tax=Physocladia obscura TaxID=109957 RepID=A0AAD5XBB8_9FUNG|nr:hypothetical protein HK100_006486 [Physocladia obscura]
MTGQSNPAGSTNSHFGLRTRRRLSSLITLVLIVAAVYSWHAWYLSTNSDSIDSNSINHNSNKYNNNANPQLPNKPLSNKDNKKKGKNNSDAYAKLDDPNALLVINYAVALDDLDDAQTRLLDFFNGELKAEPTSVFGGSLSNENDYTETKLGSDFVAAHAFALQYRDLAYNRTDFLLLGQRVRALRIAWVLLHERADLHPTLAAHSTPAFNFAVDAAGLKRRKLVAQLDAIVDGLTDLLYPWLATSHASIKALLDANRLVSQDFNNNNNNNNNNIRRGILLSTGRGHFELAVHAIVSLRSVLNCNLPIEVHHMGPNDLDSEMIKAFNAMPNVKTVDVWDYWGEEARSLGGWAIKPFALLASSFNQVMFLDADAVFLQNPEVLFTKSDIFKKYGQLFYHDRTITGYDDCYKWFNGFIPHVSKYTNTLRFQNRQTVHEMESGVIVIDKTRPEVLHALLATAKMNSKVERDGITYHLMHGDKESYWMSWELARVPYKFSRSYGGTIGYKNERDAVCGGLFHTDEYLKPLWWNGGVVANKHADKQTGYMKYEYLAYDDEGKDISWEWETPTTPFCLKAKFAGQKVVVAELSNAERGITEQLVGIYKDIIGGGWRAYFLKKFNLQLD